MEDVADTPLDRPTELGGGKWIGSSRHLTEPFLITGQGRRRPSVEKCAVCLMIFQGIYLQSALYNQIYVGVFCEMAHKGRRAKQPAYVMKTRGPVLPLQQLVAPH